MAVRGDGVEWIGRIFGSVWVVLERAVMRPMWLLVWLAGCGARTGLWVPPEAGPREDAGRDVVVDAPDDPSVDARPDAPPPPPLLCPFTTQTTLAMTTDADIDQIVVAGGYAYYHLETGVFRVPTSGGPAEKIAASRPQNWPIGSAFALDSHNVTWVTLTDVGSNVLSAPLAGGPATTLAMLDYFFDGVIVQPSGVLTWQGQYIDLKLDRIASGKVTTVGTLPGAAWQLIDDGGTLFGVGENVFRMDGATASVIAPIKAFAVAVDATDAYFTQFDDNVITAPQGIYRVDKLGKQPAVAIASSPFPGGIALSNDFVYYADRSGSVFRVDKGGLSAPVMVGSYDGQIMYVALDDACVYFTATESQVEFGSRVFVAPL